MKFSVIIPVYNSEEYLHKCIGSIMKQDYDDFELILVEDGSADASREICQTYEKKYDNVRLICQENSGPSIARNRGIDCACGEYLTFVDSDDWVMPGYFQTLDKAVAQRPDLIFSGRVHAEGTSESTMAFPAGSFSGQEQIIDFVVQNYFLGDIARCTNKVFSRCLFEDGGLRFPESTVVEEDLQFVLGAIDRSRTLISLEEGLYFYNRRESGSVTTKYNPVKFDSKLQAYETELEYARKWHSKRLEQIFDDNYLSYISASINNLMYSACPLTKQEKLDEIRRFYRAEATASCIARSSGLSMRSKVMHGLIGLKQYRLSYLIHAITFHLRRR